MKLFKYIYLMFYVKSHSFGKEGSVPLTLAFWTIKLITYLLPLPEELGFPLISTDPTASVRFFVCHLR
jgi:hypothetical protein